jgi:uncharacterized protein (TIGR03437 family)
MPVLPLLLFMTLAQDAFVTTSGGVAVIDPVANKSVATLALSAGNATVAPNGALVYITQTANANVVVVNAATQQTVATVAVGRGPAVAAVSPDSSRVYVTNLQDGTVSVIDAVTNTVLATVAVGPRPLGAAVSPDGSKVYVANSGGSTISVIDVSSNTVSSTITLPFPVAPWMVAFSIDGAKAYVTDNGYGYVYVISTATDTVAGSFRPASYNQGVAFSPNGALAFVTDAAGAVNVVNAVTDTVMHSVSLGGSPAGVAFSTDGTKAYVANGSLNEVQVVDTNNFAVTAIAIPAQPTGFGIFVQPGGAPVATAVGNGFTFLNGESPGAFIVIRGTNLASGALSAASSELPTQLAATTVLLDGAPIPLFYVSPTQINAQIPTNAEVSLTSIEVVNGTEVSNRLEFPVSSASPGIPYYVLNGTNHAAAQNGDNSLNAPGNPAVAGSLMTIYFTGVGPVTNPVIAGIAAPASPLSNAELDVSVSIGGMVVEPSFAGLSPGSIGLAQANVKVPSLAPGDYPLTITVGGFSSNAVHVSIH